MKITLIGIDPGIVDTGLVALTLDVEAKTLDIQHRVWSNVTRRAGTSILVEGEFLNELVLFIKSLSGVPFIYIEGFRNRGRDMHQDQKMTVLVHQIQAVLKTSHIVDNTGVKKVVKEGLLNLMHISRWPKTNHADLKSAARIALKGAIENTTLNQMVATYVQDTLKGHLWTITRNSG